MLLMAEGAQAIPDDQPAELQQVHQLPLSRGQLFEEAIYCSAQFLQFKTFLRSLTGIIRIRTTGCIFASYIISFFGGRQPTCITQFRLTQKSPSVVSQISERI